MAKKTKYTKIEEKIQSFWNKNDIFEKSVESRPKDKPYVFYDGPPFATGLPHYGHILSSVTKDLFPRYHTMKNERVRRRWGWDCHGLPIENLVEAKLDISGKKQIEEKGIEEFNETARSMVLEYTKEWKSMVERIGRWVEFDNSYKTMDSTYMESVWWALKQIWDRDLIYEGRKVLMYCPRCETPVSNAETQMDNSYKDVTDDSITVKFKVTGDTRFDDNTYFLAWTTTPWTLPGNVALAVGESIEYVLIKSGNDKYIFAKDRLGHVMEDKEYEVLDSFMGSDLESVSYEPLYEINAIDDKTKAWYVAVADFVTTEDGTGIVHTAVMYGEDDFNLGMELDLPQVPMLDSAGHYNANAPKFLQGKYIRKAEKEILEDLEDRGLLFSLEKYIHSYPFCWRCESPLIYNAISAWFINIQSVKDRMIELNKDINWNPSYLKEGRFLNILKSAPDWNISRNRYWATALPFWKCDNDDCGNVKCVGSFEELKNEAENFNEIYDSDKVEDVDLHRPKIDMIKLKCDSCGSQMSRVEEVVDCWVESAAMPFAEWHYPFENKNNFESRYPGQFIAEYIAQTRAWFYYMHAMGVLLFDNITYENVVSTGTILSEKGEKLSKSKKNYPDPWLIIEEFGSDALRFYLMSSVVMQAENLFFNKMDLKDVYNKVINTSYNINSFYKIYSENYDRSPEPKYEFVLDKWIDSRMNQTIKDVTHYLDEYNTVKSSRAIRDLIDDMSLWWVRRSRDRFKDGGEDGQEAFAVLGGILGKLSLIIAPFTPFMAEEIYQTVKKSGGEKSVHLEMWPQVKQDSIDEGLMEEMDKARKVVELGHSMRSKLGVKVRQPLSKIEHNVKFNSKYCDDINQIILDELNIESITQSLKGKEVETAKSDEVSVSVDFSIDEDLRDKGDVREIVRGIQSLRKKSGLKQDDKAKIVIDPENDIENFLAKNKKEIASSTNCSEITINQGDGANQTVKTSRGNIKIYLA